MSYNVLANGRSARLLIHFHLSSGHFVPLRVGCCFCGLPVLHGAPRSGGTGRASAGPRNTKQDVTKLYRRFFPLPRRQQLTHSGSGCSPSFLCRMKTLIKTNLVCAFSPNQFRETVAAYGIQPGCLLSFVPVMPLIYAARPSPMSIRKSPTPSTIRSSYPICGPR